MIEITDIRMKLINESTGKIKAIAEITIDDCFVVHDIRIIENNGSLFMAMPNRRLSDGTFKDIAHPINSETREKIQTKLLEEYTKITSGD